MMQVQQRVPLASGIGGDYDTHCHEIPNEETIAAMNEYHQMITRPDKYKRYSSFAEAMNDVFKDDTDDV